MPPRKIDRTELQRTLRGRVTPGDPFNKVIDDLVAFIDQNPGIASSSDPLYYIKAQLMMSAEKIKATVATRLGKAYLQQPGNLNIQVLDHWELNAAVQQHPPYTVYVYANLYLFCARLAELFLSGMGLDIRSEDWSQTEAEVAPKLSTAEVGVQIRQVLDSYLDRRIIAPSEISLPPSQMTFLNILFFSIMTYVISHEFGHVVINEYRNDGKAPPFGDFAAGMLANNGENLIRLHKLDKSGLPQVLDSWTEEINADIIGASLTAEYQKEQGPWKGGPGILGYTYMGIHIFFIAQLFLALYRHYIRDGAPLTSRTHPPTDFRMHCVLSWMYKEQYGEAVKHLTAYSQEVLRATLDPPR